MGIRSIRNGMYPKKIRKLEKAEKPKPTVTYEQVRQRMRKKLGW